MSIIARCRSQVSDARPLSTFNRAQEPRRGEFKGRSYVRHQPRIARTKTFKKSSTTWFLTRSTQERTLSTTSILGWFNFKLLHAWGFMSSVHLFIVKYKLIVLMGDAYLWLFSGNNSITNWVIWVVLLKIDDLSFDLSFSSLYSSELSKWAI